MVILLLEQGITHHNLPTQGISLHRPYTVLSIEKGIVLEFHSFETFGIETNETYDMSS
jgi:hypothetical protein